MTNIVESFKNTIEYKQPKPKEKGKYCCDKQNFSS